MKLILTLILCVSSIAYQASTLAADGDVTTIVTTKNIDAEKLLCPDADFWGKKMLTDVCWSCLFPIRLLGLTIFDDSDDFAILDLFVQNNCNAGGFRNLDMMYMSELDPTWNIDELAFFMNPEAVVFANPLAVASCMVDCATTTASRPMNSLFWCAGCWGNLYPFTGNIASDASAPRDTSLLTARVLAGLHRRLLAHKTYGDDVLCLQRRTGYVIPSGTFCERLMQCSLHKTFRKMRSSSGLSCTCKGPSI